MSERQIPIGGVGVKPFWAAFTSAPAVVPPPDVIEGSVVQVPAGIDDGYADIMSHSSTRAGHTFTPFHTALRVENAAVPAVTLNHAYDWFSCFSVRFGVDLRTQSSYAEFGMAPVTGDNLNIAVRIAPSQSSLAIDGSTIDITGTVLSWLASAADGFNILTIESAEFHVVAKRKLIRSAGVKAGFDIRCGFVKDGVTAELYRAKHTLVTTDVYRSSFKSSVSM